METGGTGVPACVRCVIPDRGACAIVAVLDGDIVKMRPVWKATLRRGRACHHAQWSRRSMARSEWTRMIENWRRPPAVLHHILDTDI